MEAELLPHAPVVTLPPVPDLPEREPSAGLISLAPMIGGLGSVAAVMAFSAPGQGRSRAWVVAGSLLVSTLAMAVIQLIRQSQLRARSVARVRARYAEALAQARLDLDLAATAARALAAQSDRCGESLPLRVGWARQRLHVQPAARSPDADPACAVLADRLAAEGAMIEGIPVLVDLRLAPLHVRGSEALLSARALACAAVEAGLSVDWRGPVEPWVEWLPNPDPAAVAIDVSPDGVTVCAFGGGVDRTPAEGSAAVFDLGIGRLAGPSLDSHPVVADVATSSEAALRLRRSQARRTGQPARSPVTLDPESVPIEQVWQGSGPASLTTMIGAVDAGPDAGTPLTLDLREPALGGMGPHGVIVGATGSGKSELLRTLVLGLALAHAPRQLNLLLVDFKGGAAFAGLAGLPHVCGVVTNLAAEPGAIGRVQAALDGEVTRRQHLLAEAGRASLHEWVSLHASANQAAADPGTHTAAERPGATTPPPSLVVVIDEFAELLVERPEFLETLTTIGRLGRSLGIHLVLASQRLEEGRLRGLEAHLAFRIALRTFSEAESHQVLGCPDAALLPRIPGIGILRPAPGHLVRFRSGYVSGPGGAAPATGPTPDRIRTLRSGWRSDQPDSGSPPHSRPSILERAVAVMATAPPSQRPRRIWLPPLPSRVSLGELDQRPKHSTACSPAWVPFGVIDLPRQQRRSLLRWEWSADRAAHMAVVGAARSGASTTLATLVVAAARALAPGELTVWIFDAGGSLAPLAKLPHTRVVAANDEPDLIRRAARHLGELLTSPDPSSSHHLVVIDGWETVSMDHPEAAVLLGEVVARGLGAGIQVALSARRWASLRPALREGFSRRVELRLGDPVESEIDRHRAAALPTGRPGRGLMEGGHEVQVALPMPAVRPSATEADCSLDSMLTLAIDDVARRWPARSVPRLTPIPDRLVLSDLADSPHPRVGQRESGDLWRLPSDLLVIGGPRSGRSGLLRTAVCELMRTSSPHRRQLLVLSPRGRDLPAIPDPWMLAEAHDPIGAQSALAALATALDARPKGGPDTPEIWVVADDVELLGPPIWAPLVPLLPRSGELGLHLVVAVRAHGVARLLHEPVLDHLRLRGDVALLSGPAEEGPVVQGHRMRSLPPGRALVIGQAGLGELAQSALTEGVISDDAQS